METANAVRMRLQERQQELRAELEQLQRQLDQLDTTVAVSKWWQAPSGPGGRGTAYHTGTDRRCRPGDRPDEITLYEALRAGLSPCRKCRPKKS